MPSRARSVALAALALLGTLGAAEWATRRWLQTPATVVDDPRFGRVAEPHQRYISHAEGYSVRRTNAFGFFDDDTLPVRPRRRVLLLGDSYAEGLQMAQEQTFAAVAERRVPGLELVNVAQSGRFPVYYALTLPAFQRVFRPDAVVIQVNDGDLDELASPAREEAVRRELRECAAAAGGGDESPRPRARSGLRRALRQMVLLKFMRDRFELLTIQERARWNRKWRPAAEAPAAAAAVPPAVEARLDSLVRVMRAVNPRLVLVHMPHARYFDGPVHLLYPERREFYRRFAARHGIPLVDPTDSLFAEFRSTGQPLHGFGNSQVGVGHMNALGHALVGRLLARELEREP